MIEYVDQRTQQYIERRDAEERGRAALGLVLIQRPWEQGGPFWSPRHAPNTVGLPAALVADAQQAYTAETAARGALERAETDANAYAQHHQLSANARLAHVELKTAEARTGLRETTERCQAAMIELGTAAGAIAEARQILGGIPQRRAAAELAHTKAMSTIAASEREALRTLERYGVN